MLAYAAAAVIRFPFLIGKVLTVNNGTVCWVMDGFPFLIGKVLTTAFKPL